MHFGATFSFSLLSLRATGTGPGAHVSSLTIWTAIALVVMSGAALFFFVNHAARRLRVGGMIDLVGDELRKQLDRRYPRGSQPCDPSVVTADRAGDVIHVDEPALVEAARRVDCTLELVPVIGDFVVEGAPLFRVGGNSARLDRQRLRRLIVLADERTHRDDPAYGFRKLADVAQRALGASSNDATTAVQVINRLHDCLRQIAPRPFPSGRHMDENGRLRLVVHVIIDWGGDVRLAFDEIRLAAGPYPQATRRLRAALEDLKTAAPPERQAALDRQLRLLRQAVEHDLGTPDDIRAALVPDQQGLGSGADVTVGGDSPGSADPIADASAPRS